MTKMTRRDWISIVVIGAGVGLLCQPILSTVAASSGFQMTVLLRIVIFFLFTALAPVALFILWLIGKLVPFVYQFGKFCAVGVLNTFVDIGVLNLEILLMGTPGAWGYRIFKSISFLGATTNSFMWNKFWTFDSREPASPKQTFEFYLVAFVGFLLNVGLSSYVFSNVARPVNISLNLWATIGALVGVAAAFIWNFCGYKFWVFKKPAGKTEVAA